MGISVGRELPSPWLRAVIDWRARRIRDPIERLRFLRKATLLSSPAPRGWLRRTVVGSAALAVLALVPAANYSNAIVYGKLPTLGPERMKAAPAAHSIPEVWLVETQSGSELYSNGLRVECGFEVSNERRRYGVIDRSDPEGGFKLWRSDPAGIVYHATESGIASFEPAQTGTIRRLGESVLEFVRRERAYNYLIDRFGRVYRVVREPDTAFHAGHSVWADERWLYVNLNASFLGVAFEARSQGETGQHTLSAAQVRSGRALTEMLRAKYKIPACNCVTHAQVSVNPANMRIGYHTDWAGNLPFEELGLDDNYAQALPSLYAFGFSYDPAFVKSTGMRLWKGIVLAEQELRQSATAAGLPVEEYRKILERRYKRELMALKALGATEERGDESNH